MTASDKVYVVVFNPFGGMLGRPMRIAQFTKEHVAWYTGALKTSPNAPEPTPLDCVVEIWDRAEYLKSIKGDLPF